MSGTLSPFERGLLVGRLLCSGREVTTRTLRDLFGVSRATAKRDLLVAETTLRADAKVVGSARAVSLKGGAGTT